MELSILPTYLREQAVVLADEPAWHKEDARAVIKFLARTGYAVLGVEFWVPEGDAPRVVGWSEYDVKFSGNWDHYVQSNAQHALDDIDKSTAENELLNLTWISRDEVK